MTLFVARYLDVIDYMKAAIKKAGKKHYLIVVGKLNQFKLANFQVRCADGRHGALDWRIDWNVLVIVT